MRGGGEEKRSLVGEALQWRPGAIHHPNNCFPSHRIIPIESPTYSTYTYLSTTRPPTTLSLNYRSLAFFLYKILSQKTLLIPRGHAPLCALRKPETLAILEHRVRYRAHSATRAASIRFTLFTSSRDRSFYRRGELRRTAWGSVRRER